MTPAGLPPPACEDVRYGPHPENGLDFWRASGAGAGPLVVLLHGAGGVTREFAEAEAPLVTRCLERGMCVASVDYRLGRETPYPVPMMDGARAVQFLRARAEEWGFDGRRVGAAARSAGAGIALWVAFHSDLASAAIDDSVARQSTRLRCALVRNAQTSYDPRFIRRHIAGAGWRHQAMQLLFALDDAQLDSPPAEALLLFEQASPLTHLTADAPPVYMTYSQENVPLAADAPAGRGIHHPTFGAILKERMERLGRECTLRCGPDSIDADAEVAFLDRHLA